MDEKLLWNAETLMSTCHLTRDELLQAIETESIPMPILLAGEPMWRVEDMQQWMAEGRPRQWKRKD